MMPKTKAMATSSTRFCSAIGAEDRHGERQHDDELPVDQHRLQHQRGHPPAGGEQEDRGGEHSGDRRVEELRRARDHQRTGHEALHGERAEQQHHRAADRKAEAERRDQLAGIGGVLRRLVGADALDRALAEPLRVLRDHLRLLVGDHRGDRRPGAGDGADQRADDGSADHGRDGRPPALEGGKLALAELARKILPVEDLTRLPDAAR